MSVGGEISKAVNDMVREAPLPLCFSVSDNRLCDVCFAQNFVKFTARLMVSIPDAPPHVAGRGRVQVDIVSAAGIPVVCSAGNQATDACNQSPASAPTAIAVGATRKDDSRSFFSSAFFAASPFLLCGLAPAPGHAAHSLLALRLWVFLLCFL